MMMLLVRRIKKADKNPGIGDKSTRDKWILKVIDRHRSVKQSKPLIDLQLVLCYLLFSPILLSKRPEPEVAILLISNSIVISPLILLYLVHFYTIFGALFPKLLLKLQVEIMEAVAMDVRDIVRLLDDRVDPAVVERDDH